MGKDQSHKHSALGEQNQPQHSVISLARGHLVKDKRGQRLLSLGQKRPEAIRFRAKEATWFRTKEARGHLV